MNDDGSEMLMDVMTPKGGIGPIEVEELSHDQLHFDFGLFPDRKSLSGGKCFTKHERGIRPRIHRLGSRLSSQEEHAIGYSM